MNMIEPPLYVIKVVIAVIRDEKSWKIHEEYVFLGFEDITIFALCVISENISEINLFTNRLSHP